MRLINYWNYTRSFSFILRLIFAGIFVKLANISGIDSSFGVKMLKVANWFCSKEYIFNTPFGKYIGGSLQEYVLMDENYEKLIGNIIKKVSNKKDNDKYLINIGCNVGRWTIDLAKNYGYKVLAFEPAPHTYYSLMVNIALSDLLHKITTYNLALGNFNDSLKFEYREYHNGSSHVVTGDEKDIKGNIIEVPCRKFDELMIDKEILQKTRLLIMDVEGFEYNVLKGMEKSLKEFRDINMIIEIRDDAKNRDKTFLILENAGFHYKRIDESNFLFEK